MLVTGLPIIIEFNVVLSSNSELPLLSLFFMLLPKYNVFIGQLVNVLTDEFVEKERTLSPSSIFTDFSAMQPQNILNVDNQQLAFKTVEKCF